MPGVVLVLLALLGPTYSGLQDGVQQGAASLLLDIVSTSQAGMVCPCIGIQLSDCKLLQRTVSAGPMSYTA